MQGGALTGTAGPAADTREAAEPVRLSRDSANRCDVADSSGALAIPTYWSVPRLHSTVRRSMH